MTQLRPLTDDESAPTGAAVTLGDFDGSRRNNFTTIRILLAWSVLYGHSFAIAKLPGVADPLNRVFQGSIWIGELAVNGFFAISGYLVCASFLKRGIVDYTLSRALRILPALSVCVALTALAVGPLVTTLGLREYFGDPETWTYLRNGLAFFPMQWNLPGVFSDNVRHAANGSLWTLTVEVRCYVLLAFAGFFSLLRYKHIANLTALCLFAFAAFHFTEIPLLGIREKWSRPAAYFLLGVLFYTNRERVVLDGRIAIFAAMMCAAAFGKPWFEYVFAPGLVYLIFYLAYRTPYVDSDGRVGDISYGVYIYAWPVQQLVAFLLPGMHPYTNTLLSTLTVVPVAWVSWHYLERPALALKGTLLRSDRTSQLSRVVSR